MGEVNLPASLAAIVGALEARIAELERRAAHPRVYTIATRPAATAVAVGAVIFVSDGGAGAVFQGSDGAAWVSLG